MRRGETQDAALEQIDTEEWKIAVQDRPYAM